MDVFDYWQPFRDNRAWGDTGATALSIEYEHPAPYIKYCITNIIAAATA